MAKKLFSLIIIPHSKGIYKTINITGKTVKVLSGIMGVLCLSFLILIVDYSSMNVMRQRNKRLANENTLQKQAIAKYKESTENLKKTLENFESYARKLNVIAGLKSPDDLKEVGVGGGSFGYSRETNLGNLSQDISVSTLTSINQKADRVEKNLNTLVKFFETQSIRLTFTPSIVPTRGYIASPFAYRLDPFTGKRTFHYGIDIATQQGNPVVATADGIILSTTKDIIGGLTVRISHSFGYQTIYCHLSKFLVKPGQKVKRGDVIGLVGKTGKAVGPHVHYEIRINNQPVNPYYYFLEE